MVFDCVYGRREAVATNGKPVAAESDSTSLYHTVCDLLFVICSYPQACDVDGLVSALARRLRLGKYTNLLGAPIERRRWEKNRYAILMATSVLWHGSQTEALELLQALSRNCSCVVTAEGVRLSTCAPHQMLSSDQRAIDGLLFARRIAARLRVEEFNPTSAALARSA